MSSTPPIVFYHYVGSPYGNRVLWYLTLRQIPYKQCMQPMIMPRPDIHRLGLSYRRIPILSIGRSLYIDTRLILQKLEELFPSTPRLGSPTAEGQALERLFEHMHIEGGLSRSCMQLIPSDAPMLQDPRFVKDRGDYAGKDRAFSPESMAAGRAEASVKVRSVFAMLENTVLIDDRSWILKTEKPSLADIVAIWPLLWISIMPNALPSSITATHFPKVFAWHARFRKYTKAAQAEHKPKVQTIKGDEAAATILASEFNGATVEVDELDTVVQALGLTRGKIVQLWPTDTGMLHKDVGKLIGIDENEVVIETESGEGAVRIHAPRRGFAVALHREKL